MNLSTFELFKNLKDVPGTVEIKGDTLISLQKCLLDILHDIDFTCKSEGICYYLSGGTALGALRHSGFIPWDDDLDINMQRKDYQKFCTALTKYFGDKYIVQHPGRSDNYCLTLGRIRLKNSVYRTREDINEPNAGIFIDIFLIDNTYDNPYLRKLHGVCCLATGFALSCRVFFEKRKTYQKLLSSTKEAKRVFFIKNTIGFVLSIIPVKKWAQLANFTYSFCKNNRSLYVSIPSGRKHFFGELYNRESFCTTQLLTFEDMKAPVSLGLDDYMTKLYGPTFMVPPKPEDRERHIIFELQLPKKNDN